jgi:hypothetical protein
MNKNYVKKVSLLILASALLAAAGAGCDSNPPPSPAAGCDQTCQDNQSAWAITAIVWFLFDQNIAGAHSGNINLTVSCPLGGNVVIKGTAVWNSSDTLGNINLSYAFSACQMSDPSYNLTLTGSVTQSGTFVPNAGIEAMTYTSSSLGFTGQVNLAAAEVAITNTACVLGLTTSGDGTQSGQSTTGAICGQTDVSY